MHRFAHQGLLRQQTSETPVADRITVALLCCTVQHGLVIRIVVLLACSQREQRPLEPSCTLYHYWTSLHGIGCIPA